MISHLPLWLSETAPALNVKAPSGADLALQLTQVLVSLGLVLGLIFAMAWFVRRRPAVTGQRHIEIVERLSLGQKEQLVLVRVAGQSLLVGVSPAGIQMLQSLDADALNQPQQMPEAEHSFAAHLSQLLAARLS